MIAYIFDVDGVVTNPAKKIVDQKEILQIIAKLLEKNSLVTFNTGRSISWLNERVLKPLLREIQDKTLLSNLFAVGEKGGIWVSFDHLGNTKHLKDETISVSKTVQDEIKSLIQESYLQSMFFDNSKETMISIEMADGFSLTEFTELQKKLVIEINNILQKNNLNQTLKIDPTTIATDIQNIQAGKDFAVERILSWIKSSGFNPERFLAFGDSKSDIPMAEYLAKNGFKVELIYVGLEKLNKYEYHFPIYYTNEKFDKGTFEYLTNFT